MTHGPCSWKCLYVKEGYEGDFYPMWGTSKDITYISVLIFAEGGRIPYDGDTDTVHFGVGWVHAVLDCTTRDACVKSLISGLYCIFFLLQLFSPHTALGYRHCLFQQIACCTGRWVRSRRLSEWTDTVNLSVHILKCYELVSEDQSLQL